MPRRPRRQKQHGILLPHRVQLFDLPKQRITISKLRLKLRLHFRTNFETTLPNPRPNRSLLKSARDIQSKLVHADDRISVVVGVGQETVTAVARRRDDFVYTITRHGDGTVPAVSAGLPGVRNHFTLAAHSDLTRDATVAAAVTDLLRTGKTERLPSKWKSGSTAQAQISDRQLRLMHTAKVDWAGLEPHERREFLENLNEPPKLKLRVPAKKKKR